MSQLPIKQTTCAKVDLGYLGIKNLHQNSELPHKASKLKPLTDTQKEENQKKLLLV